MASVAAGSVAAMPLVGIAVWLGWRTHHYPFLNDFWPLLFWADTLDWSDIDSFKNGFFPPGYPFFLNVVGDRYILANAYYANVLFGLGTVLGVCAVTYRFTMSVAAAMMASALTAFYPLNFSLVMTTGPDTGCTFMLCAAFFLVHLADGESRLPVKSAAGWSAALLFAAAALWRYHALVFAIMALTSTAAVSRARINWRAATGVLAVLAVLVALSLFPGFSLQLGRAQAFGVWEAMHPVNWYRMPTDFPQSVQGVIRAEPELFLRAYWQFHRPYLWLVGPPFLAALFLRGDSRRIAASILLLELVYIPVVGIGTSLRGFAPVVPLTMTCIGLLVAALAGQVQRVIPGMLAPATAVVIVLIIAWQSWLSPNLAFVEASIAGFEWRRSVELELRAQGVTAPLQVFGDSGFHFVLRPGPGWYSYLARSNGGWPRLDLYRLNEIAPEIDTTSLEAFVLDCERSGITHLVLSATAGGMNPELGELFAGRRNHPQLQQTAEVAGFKIFRLGGRRL